MGWRVVILQGICSLAWAAWAAPVAHAQDTLPLTYTQTLPGNYLPGEPLTGTLEVHEVHAGSEGSALGVAMQLPPGWTIYRDPARACRVAVTSVNPDIDMLVKHGDTGFESPGVCVSIPFPGEDLELAWIPLDFDIRLPDKVGFTLVPPATHAPREVAIGADLLYRIGHGGEQRARGVSYLSLVERLDAVAEDLIGQFSDLDEFGLGIPAWQQQDVAPEVLEKIDTDNNNNYLSRRELQRFGVNRPVHSIDQNANGAVTMDELLRVIQLFNAAGYQCDAAGEDGYQLHAGDSHDCLSHASDYADPRFVVDLSELLRSVQLFTLGGYTKCTGYLEQDDGYCPGKS